MTRNHFHELAAGTWLIVLVPLLTAGCSTGDCAARVLVRGRLVDAESGDAVAGAILGGRSFTDGTETDDALPLIFDGTPRFPLSDADGSFVLSFGTSIVPCDPAPIFPRPDQLEVIIIRDGCEQRLTIEITEETAQFIEGEFSDYTLVLTDPILVPPCEESP